MYADDGILITTFLTQMQEMLNICQVYACDFDLVFNAKSEAIRIGSRYLKSCSMLSLDGVELPYVKT